MKAQYRDSDRAGYGELIFSEALFPGEPWSIAIQRASDRKFLTGKKSNPWVGETIFLAWDGEARSDGTLAIALGPDVVDELDPQEQYALTLRGDGPKEKARLRVRNITYSAAGALSAPQPTVEPTPPPPPPQQPPQPTAQPVLQAQQPQAAPGLAPLQMPSSQTPAGKSRPWLWIALALLALAAVGAFVLLQNDKKADEKSASPQKEAPAPKAESPKSPHKTPSAEEQVRKFFSGGSLSPTGAAELAAKLPKNTPAEQDAVYRLWYFAAENGEISVLPMYGACLDPSLPQFGSIEKNVIEAWTAYQKLRENQPQKAEASMLHLREWLQKQDSQGNAQARVWLEQIKQQ